MFVTHRFTTVSALTDATVDTRSNYVPAKAPAVALPLVGLWQPLSLLSFLAVFLLLVSVSVFAEERVWEEQKDKHGIKVYTADTPVSKFDEFKADAIIDAPIETFKQLLNNPETYVKWMDGVKESKLIKQINDRLSYSYIVQSVPVLKDRHAVLEVKKVEQGANEVTYFVEYTEDAKRQMPKTDKYIDIALMRGFYRLTNIDGKKTKVEMQAVADPAGSIPAWLANMFVVDTPYNTLRNLQEIALAKNGKGSEDSHEAGNSFEDDDDF